MDSVIELLKWAIQSGPHFIAALNAVLVAVIALCMMIPGDQPEKFLKEVVDFLSRFSAKPKE